MKVGRTHHGRMVHVKHFGLVVSMIPITIATINFHRYYLGPMATPIKPMLTAQLGYYAEASFIATYLVFTCCLTLAILWAWCSKNASSKAVALLLGNLFALLAVYSIRLTLQITLPVAVGTVLGCAILNELPYRYPLTALAILTQLILMRHPTIFGTSIIAMQYEQSSASETIIFMLILCTVGILGVLLRNTFGSLMEERQMISHQQQVTTQLSLFNQQLQEHAKEIGQESALKERNRISREMHDSAGYVYTNIMALVDAAISGGGRDWSHTEDLLHAASMQARDGLQETRRTLRVLRAIEPPIFSSIDSIYQITRIFSEVTGIVVQIEIGNMERDYGSDINRTLCRIVQEALTNSIRHGRATKVTIQFWVSHRRLCMIVTDNGVGSRQVVKGIGLAGMEERLEALHGSVETASPEEGGFRLIVYIPLFEDEHKETNVNA